MAKVKNELIRIVSLGGVGEIGKNMYVIEVDSELFIIDSGLMFPEDEMLGIDIVIPDTTWLEDQQERIKGIFLTHGHEDALGALPYILQKIKAPVYGSKLTIALAKEKMKEHGVKANVRFQTVKSSSKLRFDGVAVSFFQTTHTIPDALGVCIHTSEGKIVHTGDFKFDQTVTGAYRAEMGKMAVIGDQNVFCLLSDSTGAEQLGYAPSEAEVERGIEKAFHNAEGRIIIACFASNFIRIQQTLDAAIKTGRKVALVGKSFEKSFQLAIKLGYIQIEAEDLLIPVQEIKKYEDDQIVIISTGAMGEPIEALKKMATKNHKLVSIKPGDTVLIAATVSPGLETIIVKTVDLLYRAGADVINPSKQLIHTSGHGMQEDLKLMINLMKPKYFIPIQGEYRMLMAHAKLAEDIGIPSNHILIPEKGGVIEYKNGKMSFGNKVSAGNVLIDGIGVGDVGNIVLRDRKLLSQDGIFTVVVTLDKKRKRIASGPEIISRGFVYVRESEHLIEESAQIVQKIVENAIKESSFDWTSIKQEIRDKLNQYLFDKTKRRPMILPIIMEI